MLTVTMLFWQDYSAQFIIDTATLDTYKNISDLFKERPKVMCCISFGIVEDINSVHIYAVMFDCIIVHMPP